MSTWRRATPLKLQLQDQFLIHLTSIRRSSPSNMPANDTSSHASTSDGTEPGKDFYYAVKPNQMTYTDDTGVSRSIHIPRGKNEEACRHFANEDWKALSLFPIWSM
jgi:hypothetical protein